MEKENREKIAPEKILLVASKSRFELELARYGSEEQAKKHFGSKAVWENIREGHLAQKENLGKVIRKLSPEQVVDRSQLNEENLRRHDLFAFLGGDNHFTYCAQILLDYQRKHPLENKMACGVVLDPRKSLGALLYFQVGTFLESLPALEKGDYGLERWTTLEAKVDNGVGCVQPLPALGDYFFGEKNRLLMSRNRVYLDGKEVLPEKSSGILIACGAATGPGSWYNNIHRQMFDQGDVLGREEELARVILTEQEDKKKLTLHPGQILVIHSYNDDYGIIAPDSHLDHGAEFRIGCQAEAKISKYKLKIVKRK